jgi:hypothetical protein
MYLKGIMDLLRVSALLRSLVDLGPTDDWWYMVDSTIILASCRLLTLKGALQGGFWSITRHRRPLRQS